jgi:hypothetical protein
MPYREFTTPFTGDDDIADFMLDVWLDFATDTGPNGGMAWVDQNVAARGSHPDYEFWVSKGTIMTPAAPFVFYRTTLDNMNIFTGDGIDVMQELFDQPNNPMNCPGGTTMAPDFSSGNYMQIIKALYMNRMDGTYDKAWLFGDIGSNYIHCVIKTRTREYRHFHVGLLSPLHSDLDPSSFYVTGHAWSNLRLDEHGEVSAPADGTVEHSPYGDHLLPFKNNNTGHTSGDFKYQANGQFIYIPNLGVNVEDWYYMTGSPNQNEGTRTPSSQFSTPSKGVGDVNAISSSTFYGVGHITGYDASLGAILFACDKTFTSNFRPLIPIYVACYTDFSGDIRQAPVAQIPDVFRINMKDIDAEEEITVGSDTYTCFPIINKDSANTVDGEGYSAWEGLAYKKITADIT